MFPAYRRRFETSEFRVLTRVAGGGDLFAAVGRRGYPLYFVGGGGLRCRGFRNYLGKRENSIVLFPKHPRKGSLYSLYKTYWVCLCVCGRGSPPRRRWVERCSSASFCSSFFFRKMPFSICWLEGLLRRHDLIGKQIKRHFLTSRSFRFLFTVGYFFARLDSGMTRKSCDPKMCAGDIPGPRLFTLEEILTLVSRVSILTGVLFKVGGKNYYFL